MTDIAALLEYPDEIQKGISLRLKKRRLEKGLTRANLAFLSGVPAPTIAHFETTSKISLESFVKIAVALGFVDELKNLFRETAYSSMEELQSIKRNLNRKRGKRNA